MNNNKSFVSLFFATCIIALGMVALIGWYLRLPTLIQINSAFAPMQINTALGFLFCGFGLFFLNLGKSNFSIVFASFPVLLGSLTLSQYAFGWNLGIDEFFMEAYVTVKTSHPGRMSPNTAICFILSGAALFILSTSLALSRKLASVGILSTCLFVLSAGAFVGYMANLEIAFGWGELTRMALHTGFGFLAIIGGIFFFSWRNSKSVQSQLSRFQIILTSFAITLLSILLAAAQYSNESRLIKTNVENKGMAVNGRLTTSVRVQTQALIRMAERWGAEKNPEYAVWELDAKNYIKHFKSFVSIHWVDHEFKEHWSTGASNAHPIPVNSSTLQIKQNVLKKVEETKETWISKSFSFPSSEKGFFTIVPLYTENQLKGYIVGTVAVKQLLANLLQGQYRENFSLQIYEGNELLFQQGEINKELKKQWAYKKEISLYNALWTLYLFPSTEGLSKSQTYLPHIMLIVGLLMSYFLSTAIHLYQQVLKEKKQVEKIKHEHELILKSVGEGIFGLNLEGYTTFANPAAIKMLGYTESELLDKLQHALIHHTKPDGTPYPREDCHIYAAFIDGKVHRETEEVFWRKDGTSFPVEYISTPIKLNENVIGAVVTFRDITERKRADRLILEFTESIKESNKKLALSNKELDDFAYIVSHDLKEPLRGIYNYSEFLKEDYSEILDDEGKSKLDTLVRLSQRMELLINNILQYARIGRSEIKMETVDLNNVLLEVLDDLHFLLTESGVDLRVPHPLPEFICDAIWVKEVFQNLIGNAIKYNDKNEKWVEVGCLPNNALKNITSTSGNASKENTISPVFYVRDNGIGIPEKHHDSLFRIFKRLNGRKKFSDGAGAGTTIAKKVIELHNGKIWLESTMGEGTTFFFTLGGEHEP